MWESLSWLTIRTGWPYVVYWFWGQRAQEKNKKPLNLASKGRGPSLTDALSVGCPLFASSEDVRVKQVRQLDVKFSGEGWCWKENKAKDFDDYSSWCHQRPCWLYLSAHITHSSCHSCATLCVCVREDTHDTKELISLVFVFKHKTTCSALCNFDSLVQRNIQEIQWCTTKLSGMFILYWLVHVCITLYSCF